MLVGVWFDTKIAVLLRDDLEPWQRLNVTAFLISGITAARPELVGEAYQDADDTGYLPLLGQPVLIFAVDAGLMAAARLRALSRGLRIAIYTREMFETGNDVENRTAVRAVSGEKLDLVGLALHGQRNAVDKVIKGATLHP